MKINYTPHVEYLVITHNDCRHVVYAGKTFEDALNYVRENWVEGEGFNVKIQATTRWESVVLCTITDDDPRDYTC